MNTIVKALIWAVVIIAVALAGRAGWISSDAAQTLTISLPVLAFLTLGSTRRCAPQAELRA